MRAINICFQVHQPYRLRTYRFFNIGDDHHYYDDYQNRHIIRRVAERSYLPANQLLKDLIKEFGSSFKVSFSISGSALEQLLQHAPEVIHGFQELAATGCVEFLAETYSHSLSSLKSQKEFERQVRKHRDRIQNLFGQTPTVFRNTELIYTDEIGRMVYDLGFSTMITEGAKHIMGWKSPNFLYCSALNPKLKLLMRNFQMSDDLIFRFSNTSWAEWPLTAEKFTHWMNSLPANEEVINLFLNYETIGEQQAKETGIFDFFRSLPGHVFSKTNFGFTTSSEASRELQPVAPITVLYPISWADAEKDTTAWLGNELQDEAFTKLYGIEERVFASGRADVMRDWERLQTSDHFYYMCTKWFSDGEIHKYFNPYSSPYEAFINYMNVLSDFIIRAEEEPPVVLTEKPPVKAARAPGRARKTASAKSPAHTKKAGKKQTAGRPKKSSAKTTRKKSDK
jgi:alpha-amylase